MTAVYSQHDDYIISCEGRVTGGGSLHRRMEDMVASGHHEKSKERFDASEITTFTGELSDSSTSFSCSEESGDLADRCRPSESLQHGVPQHELLVTNSAVEVSTEEVFPGKFVRFHPEIECHVVIHRLDYSEEEKFACWYIKSEVAKVRKEAQGLVNMMESGAMILDDIVLPSSRGLENFTTSGARVANLNHCLAVEAVLTEQVQQELTGTYDDKAIAKKYRKVSLRCRFPARMKALQDQEEVHDKPKSSEGSSSTMSNVSSNRMKTAPCRPSTSQQMYGKLDFSKV